MSIPFIDLKAQLARIEPGIRARMDRVLEHGQFILGPEVTELEQELARFVGVKHAISCASGTDALLMPLMAYGVGPGDAIFTTPFTFIASAEVIALARARPVFVDIDPQTFNIDPERLEAAVAQVRAEGRYRPRGIIPVDLFGLPADYDAITAVAKRHDLFVLEDAAQSFGGVYHGRRAGALGHAGATSFFPAKPLGCYGDGGAIFTDDNDLAAKLVSIRVHGQGRDKYENVRIGLNGRLDTLQAAILLEKLAVFPEEIEARQHIAEHYNTRLRGLIETPSVPKGRSSAWAQYSVLALRRSEIQAALRDAGIPTAIYYPIPLHLQMAFATLGHKPGDFPCAERIASQIFSLPMHPYLSDQDMDLIVATIRRACGARPTPGADQS